MDNDIKKIYFYDFDNTLVKQPPTYQWDTTQDEEDNEFMESPESLKCDFEIQPETFTEYQQAAECPESLTVILTNRTIKLRGAVLEILSDLGLDFDATLFRIKDRSKGNRLISFLNQILNHHNIEEIYFWDDKEKHIQDVERVADEFPEINFNVTQVTSI